MTCVAAVVENGKVYMAADSYLGCDNRALSRSKDDAKLFRHPSGILVGTCGDTLAQRRVRRAMLPVREPGQDLLEYVFEALAPALAHRGGELGDFELLVGIEGRLFRLFSNTLALECVDGFAAIGSGGPVALGSLATPSDASPATRVRRAVAIAERYVPTVRGPIISVSGTARAKFPGVSTTDAPDRRLSKQWHDLDRGVEHLTRDRRAA
jgi:ATP-dependent protease HslVU (ClpYQ) peptidase subunit